MKHTTPQSARSAAWTIIVALVAGLVVLLLLAPGSVVTTDPPQCYAMLFYSVPCDAWVAPLAGIATAGVVGLGLWMNGRRRH